MPDGAAHLIPLFGGCCNAEFNQARVRCLFCGDLSGDFVHTEHGFACLPCVGVCVEFVLRQLGEPRQLRLPFGRECRA